MDTNNRNEWRNAGDENERSSTRGIRSDADQRPVIRDTTSSDIRDISDFRGEVPGSTINTTNAGSGAMLGSTSGSSRDYERNPAFNRSREGETYRGYGQGQGSQSSYRNQRSENQYGGQYSRTSSPYEQEYRVGENRNYRQQYQGGGQERGYQGQHRTRHSQYYAGGQGSHDYGQSQDWNQSHGSNWANQERRRQEQQRGTQGISSNRFEDQQNQYRGEGSQNRNYEGLSRDRDYGSQSGRGYNKGHDYGPGSYAEELNRDYGQRMRRGHESYGGSNDFSGGMYGSSNHGGGRYIGEGYEQPRNYGGATISGGGGGGRSSYDRERNRNYGAGSGSEQGSSYSGASSYGGGGNYGAGYGRNRTGTPDYGSNPRESSRIRRDRDFYQNRNSQRNEEEEQGFLDKIGDRVQSWFGGNENDRNR